MFWLQFLGNVKINPDVTRRALHDKGEKAAVESEFPSSPLSACCRHLIPNMRDARVYEDKYVWLQVTKALTRKERDEARSKLQKVAPQQARWLQDSILPHQSQQSEMLHLGRPTQAFNCSTNNVAESTGYLLVIRPVGELAVRKRGPADAIYGLCEVLCKQSAKKEN
jgi:hypothetical protein